MKRFSVDLFKRFQCDLDDPDSCWDAVAGLWPLSCWVIKPEYLAAACKSPRIPTSILEELQDDSIRTRIERGCCYVLFAFNKDILNYSPYLRNSFALPLVWREQTFHDVGLPDSLKKLADDILHAISPSVLWGLNFNWETMDKEKYDLQDLDLLCDSGWATLAGSLLLAIEGGTPDSKIWASAAWDKERGVQPVDNLEVKIETVYDFGGKMLFVSQEDMEDAQEISQTIAQIRHCDIVDIAALSSGKSDHRIALQPYLIKLDYPPDKLQPLDIRCDYYFRQNDHDKDAAYNYYVDNLVDDLAEECRKRGIPGLSPKDLGNLENLISFASLNTGALLVLSIIKARRVLLFYTKQSQSDLPKFEKIIHRSNGIIEKVFLDLDDSKPDEDQIIYKAVQNFIGKYGADKTAIDISPGPKNFSVIASWTVDPGITPCLYLGHSWDKKKRSLLPGKEQLRRLEPARKEFGAI